MEASFGTCTCAVVVPVVVPVVPVVVVAVLSSTTSAAGKGLGLVPGRWLLRKEMSVGHAPMVWKSRALSTSSSSDSNCFRRYTFSSTLSDPDSSCSGSPLVVAEEEEVKMVAFNCRVILAMSSAGWSTFFIASLSSCWRSVHASNKALASTVPSRIGWSRSILRASSSMPGRRLKARTMVSIRSWSAIVSVFANSSAPSALIP
mmetsp:Transcript_32383/g.54141  ORF Transcript_32383/g.54141 Transcript_32383/m.54141 type:complete len:203 (-) Transcript_32383:246-854(-)